MNKKQKTMNQEQGTRNQEQTSSSGFSPQVSALPAALPPDVVLRVSNVSKKFCKNLRRSMGYGIKDLAQNMVGIKSDSGELRKDEFWAVKNVSFELKRGECLGLIGQNGCGKTTLLRLLTGIFPPDKGEIAVRGRVGALISLGAGFHPHMTGRENIYLNAAILGLTRYEINQAFNDIVDFAGLGEFIDAPVSTYSSGMRVKLGFAIAINVQCDLLLIDEVLAVGDIGFKIKCLNAIRKLTADIAVVFVSHSMQFVSQFCTRIMVLERGHEVCDTLCVDEGIDRYLSVFPVEKIEAGTGVVRIENVCVCSGDQTWGEDKEGVIVQGEEAGVSFDLVPLGDRAETVRISMSIHDQALDPVVCLLPVQNDAEGGFVLLGRIRVKGYLGMIDLNAGKYSMVIGVVNVTSGVLLARVQGVGRFRVSADLVHWGRIVRECKIRADPF